MMGIIQLVLCSVIIGAAMSASTISTLIGGESWALLVATSKDFDNHPHQAAIYQTYQTLRNRGFPADHIVTMAYDDITEALENALPGHIHTEPGSRDVRENVEIDYIGADVNATNFLAVLSGQKDKIKGGNGRVIESGPNDRLFVYVVGLGAEGVITFPESGILTARRLRNALEDLHDQRRFGKLIFFLDSPFSGAMFDGLIPGEWNVYAITSTLGSEDMVNCHCDQPPSGECMITCFGLRWLHDCEDNDLNKRTIGTQVDVTRAKASDTKVSEFGDLRIRDEIAAKFFGNAAPPADEKTKDRWDVHGWSKHKTFETATKRLERKIRWVKNNDYAKKSFAGEIDVINKRRNEVVKNINALVKRILPEKNAANRALQSKPSRIRDLDCHHDAIRAYHKHCYNLIEHPYALTSVRVLTNLCNGGVDRRTLVEQIAEHCAEKPTPDERIV